MERKAPLAFQIAGRQIPNVTEEIGNAGRTLVQVFRDHKPERIEKVERTEQSVPALSDSETDDSV